MGLTADGCKTRRRQLLSMVDADVLVVVDPRHVFYLTNLLISPLEFGSWGRPFLLIDQRDERARLVVDNFLAGRAQSAHVDELDVWTWYSAGPAPGVPSFREAADRLDAALRPYAGRRLGIERGWTPHLSDTWTTVDMTDPLITMRRRKHPDELHLIREAIQVAEAGHAAARSVIRPGITELDLHTAIYAAMVEQAGHPILLMGDILSGDRALAVAGPPTPRTLQPGELVILDLAPIVNGYRADHTSTIAVNHTLTPTQEHIAQALHGALAAGEARLHPNTRTADVYAAVRDRLEQDGLAAHFPHHAGHGLGLGHPEAPYLVPESEETLVAGDVITLEPGVYFDGMGARVEHDYLVTVNGPVRLSNHSLAFA